jgi:aminopeptidase
VDERLGRHAEVLVDYCTDVEPGDEVLVRAPAAAEALVTALYERLGERGANATTWLRSPRAGRAKARATGPDDFSTSEHRLAAMRETDAVILVHGATNRAAQADVDPAKGGPVSRARQLSWRPAPTPGGSSRNTPRRRTQAAETSTEAW